jgi:anti-sigma regulatory factor (Ser/Thr protein kinase)
MEKNDKKLIIEADMDNLHTVLDFVEAEIEKTNCPHKIVKQIIIIVEELFVNVSSYAYETGIGVCTIQITSEQTVTGGRIRLSMRDRGKKFNPLEQTPPDITLSAEEREIGGLGILMVRGYMDRMEYQYEHGENIVSVEKDWETS